MGTVDGKGGRLLLRCYFAFEEGLSRRGTVLVLQDKVMSSAASVLDKVSCN